MWVETEESKKLLPRKTVIMRNTPQQLHCTNLQKVIDQPNRKKIKFTSVYSLLDNYNENQCKLQQWLEGISTLVTSMFSKSHLGLNSRQMLLFLFFLSEVNFIFLVWLVNHFLDISKVQLIGDVSHFHGQEFFTFFRLHPLFLRQQEANLYVS